MAELFAKCDPLTLQVMRSDAGRWRDMGAALGTERMAAAVRHVRPGESLPQHRHRVQEELYHLVAGGPQTLLVGGLELTVDDGEWVRLARGAVRQVVNRTDRDATWLMIAAPAVDEPDTLPG